MQLIQAGLNDLPDIYLQMQKNFIRDEIRDYDDARKVFGNKKYAVYHVSENGENVGFMCVWTLDGFCFLEHFVIYEQFRGKGCGGAALELLKNKCGLLILECEPPESPQQKRRVDFYVRHGMVINDYEYWQPSYRKDGERCYLKLMSTQRLAHFNDTVKEIYKEVYGIDYE